MKKLIFVLCLGVMSMISCADMFVQCPNELACDYYDVCCTVGHPYACGGLCWTSELAAASGCAYNDGYFWHFPKVDHCYAE